MGDLTTIWQAKFKQVQIPDMGEKLAQHHHGRGREACVICLGNAALIASLVWQCENVRCLHELPDCLNATDLPASASTLRPGRPATSAGPPC